MAIRKSNSGQISNKAKKPSDSGAKKDPAAATTLNEDALKDIVGGVSPNTYRTDPYKGFKF